VKQVLCNMLAEDTENQAICKKLGFRLAPLGDKLVRAEINL
jgi:hypothetical protein